MSAIAFLLVSLALTSATLSIIFFMAWRALGRKPHALSFSLAFAFGTLQWSGNLARDFFPSLDSYWLVVNALALATATLAVHGHLQRVGRSPSIVALVSPAALCLTALVVVTYVVPHAGIRLALIPAYAAATLWVSAWLIWQFRPAPLPAERGAAIALAVFALCQTMTAGIAIANGVELSPALTPLYQYTNFLVMPAAYTGAGMFVVLVIASDLAEDMREMALTDQLTGLLNRRGFAGANAALYARARRSERPVSVIMTDIDHFKQINDEFGHATGDAAIVHFADVLNNGRRSEDILARIGGEEFALILPGADVDESLAIACNLCQALEDTPLIVAGDRIRMTASFGVATLSLTDTCMTDAIVRADTALYQSKEKGRNRVDLEASAVTLMPDGALVAAAARLATTR